MKRGLIWLLVKKDVIGIRIKYSVFSIFMMVVCLLLSFPSLSFSQNATVGRIRRVDYQNKIIVVKTGDTKNAFNDKYTFQVLPDTKFYIKSKRCPASFEGLKEDELLLPGIKVRLITVKHNLIKVFVMEVPE